MKKSPSLFGIIFGLLLTTGVLYAAISQIGPRVNVSEVLPWLEQGFQSSDNWWTSPVSWVNGGVWLWVKDIMAPWGCKRITNTTTNQYFIPTKTEWQNFMANTPTGISIWDCPASPSGWGCGGEYIVSPCLLASWDPNLRTCWATERVVYETTESSATCTTTNPGTYKYNRASCVADPSCGGAQGTWDECTLFWWIWDSSVNRDDRIIIPGTPQIFGPTINFGDIGNWLVRTTTATNQTKWVCLSPTGCWWEGIDSRSDGSYSHNSGKCDTDGYPKNEYCDTPGENATIVTCCDWAWNGNNDCFKYACSYRASCTPSIPASCGWWDGLSTGLGNGNAVWNTTQCYPTGASATNMNAGHPKEEYCDNAWENGNKVICCEQSSNVDCFRYTCSYGASCTPSTAPTTTTSTACKIGNNPESGQDACFPSNIGDLWRVKVTESGVTKSWEYWTPTTNINVSKCGKQDVSTHTQAEIDALPICRAKCRLSGVEAWNADLCPTTNIGAMHTILHWDHWFLQEYWTTTVSPDSAMCWLIPVYPKKQADIMAIPLCPASTTTWPYCEYKDLNGDIVKTNGPQATPGSPWCATCQWLSADTARQLEYPLCGASTTSTTTTTTSSCLCWAPVMREITPTSRSLSCEGDGGSPAANIFSWMETFVNEKWVSSNRTSKKNGDIGPSCPEQSETAWSILSCDELAVYKNQLCNGNSVAAGICMANKLKAIDDYDARGCSTTTSAACIPANNCYEYQSCFVAGTQITLADGRTKSIEDVEIGEVIQTYDEISQTMQDRPVTETFHHASKESTLYTFEYDNTSFTSNDIHLIYLPKENNYLSAKDIYTRWKKGEVVYFLNRENILVKVNNIQEKRENLPLYNLHVNGVYDTGEIYDSRKPNHNYFANGIVVHNYKTDYDTWLCERECDIWTSCRENGNQIFCQGTAQDKIQFNACIDACAPQFIENF